MDVKIEETGGWSQVQGEGGWTEVKGEVKDEADGKPEVKNENGKEAGGSKEAASGSSAKEDARNEEDLLKEFFSEMRDVDRDNEVNRIIWAFKLNPFEQLNLRFDASLEDIRRQYRKISLMVHPDKCKHPQASSAFEILGKAQKELLDDELRTGLLGVLNMAREDVRAERKKQTKHDSVIRLASMVHEQGRAGVEADWEQTDDFHNKWKVKSRDLLAKSEWRRRKLTKRLKDETARVETEEKAEREKMKEVRNHEKKWEETRETRVGTWRDFMTKKKGSGSKVPGELKPPKMKTNDEERLYVQRPVGEQFRPPEKKKQKK